MKNESKTIILSPTKENILLAAKEIKAGGLVVFPTETVYGLGGNALSPSSIKKIFSAKQRPEDNPLIAHVASIEQIEHIAFTDEKSRRAIKALMPGAITLVLKKKKCVPYALTGGLETVAVRMPDNNIAIELIKACNFAVAAPSANASGRPSPTNAEHAFSDLNGKIKYILDGGECKIGLESTILDFSKEDRIRLLRLGGIPLEDLQSILGAEIEVVQKSDIALCPGMKYRHYAPKAKVILTPHNDKEGIDKLLKEYPHALVLSLNFDCGIRFENINQYASRLFFEFRRADQENKDVIICEMPLDVGLGATINNRLQKAATK